MQTKSLIKSLLVALPLSIVSTLTLAAPQDELKRVEVSGRQEGGVRTDVKTSCPGIAAVLQKKLSPVWEMTQETGLIRVDFTLDAQGVHGIQSKGANTYRDSIRRAMRDLECTGAGTQPQHYAFNIHVVSPDKLHPGNQVALLID
ncbi:hypothetical protein J7U46_13025 [Pelomonas sp. V22]|uniref:hypothetical protein n=1 Tax=Pelomonas sp. V22 TaxID=2822139 RepID=UPI0024A92615|nr:hypothetical protein [Pelomonas sp. V22]MDI4633974.1 hypothetical protein [Pelomonas sp. V22]